MFSQILKHHNLCILVIFDATDRWVATLMGFLLYLYVTIHLILFIDTMHGNQVGGSGTMIDLQCQTL